MLALSLPAQDKQLLAARDLVGTARYTAMAGAMTAVGGDAAAVMDNPAGLGVYRKLEMEVSLGFQYDQTRFNSVASSSRMTFIPTIASVVFHMPNYKGGAVVHNNILVGFRRTNNTRRFHDGTADWLYYENDYAGYTNTYNLSWGIDVLDKLYLGLGANASYASHTTNTVRYLQGVSGYEDHVSHIMTGWAASASAGLIYHPIRPLRLGVSIESPSIGQLSHRNYAYGEYYVQEWGRYDKEAAYEEDVTKYTERMYLPMRLTAGVALQAGKIGLLSLEYDYAHLRGIDDIHTLKAGLEGVILNHVFLNLGYAYESTFVRNPMPYMSDNERRYDSDFRYTTGSHYVGAGLGYQSRLLMVRLAYRYRLQQEDIYPLARTGFDRQLSATTHNVVLTLAFTK